MLSAPPDVPLITGYNNGSTVSFTLALRSLSSAGPTTETRPTD